MGVLKVGDIDMDMKLEMKNRGIASRFSDRTAFDDDGEGDVIARKRQILSNWTDDEAGSI